VTGTGTPLVVRLLSEQRKRCLATILTAAESSPWWPRLSDGQQSAYRDQVRAALSIFYDLARDILKVTEDDTVRNELALQLIRSVHAQQLQITAKFDHQQPVHTDA
jgi:hypothetical protein